MLLLVVEVDENCAHMGGWDGPCEEVGGVLFSLSLFVACGVNADISLLERFILLNMLVKAVLDLLFFNGIFSVVSLSFDVLPASPYLRLEGDAGGDCTFECRSPSTLDLETWG